ncbi:hypothetical protein KEM56_006924 [Ascosphaera pollenicola]|nr:hypothetical protein KEM56_006924 [Ascosphaera pollenicola]
MHPRSTQDSFLTDPDVDVQIPSEVIVGIDDYHTCTEHTRCFDLDDETSQLIVRYSWTKKDYWKDHIVGINNVAIVQNNKKRQKNALLGYISGERVYKPCRNCETDCAFDECRVNRVWPVLHLDDIYRAGEMTERRTRPRYDPYASSPVSEARVPRLANITSSTDASTTLQGATSQIAKLSVPGKKTELKPMTVVRDNVVASVTAREAGNDLEDIAILLRTAEQRLFELELPTDRSNERTKRLINEMYHVRSTINIRLKSIRDRGL